MNPFHIALYALLSIALFGQCTLAFNPLSKTNVVNYWGQNSVSFTGGTEGDLVTYCQDDTVDVFVIAFISQIVNGAPILNLANHCETTFPGSRLLNCPKVGQDIKACQAKGKALVISIGGASGSYSIEDPAAGAAFAEQIWNMFLGGNSATRPFGDAILDGVDLDLESGTNKGYVAFIETLRAKFATASRPYYVTSAPQCPYPDLATQAALNAAWFDLVLVQFYNNYCGVQSYGTSNFNFDTWNKWATDVSINKNVRVLLGVPGGPKAAGSGVIGASQLITILGNIKSYSNFGGVMMWDVGIAKQSGLAVAAANYLHGLPSTTTTTSTRTTTTTITTTVTSTTPTRTTTIPTTTPGPCSAPYWSATATYGAQAQVSYNGRLYTALWWSQNNIPTDGAPWSDNGPCSGTAPSPTATPPSGSCGSVGGWSSSTAYSGGAKVSYAGFIYTAQWWTQGETPGSASVWVKGAACTGTLRRRLYANRR
ncbi:Chitinase 1 [Linnemannia schmuckeri]|uniref:chitinase n=1 Tax=Linnemannia schmuckeri TaxID=64567 RepID=A0A9P5V520_9FUNG|nr:Chitinase 1 [Linnemannia schmuckeri]